MKIPTIKQKFGIGVKFQDSTGWSKEYHYLSDIAIPLKVYVIVKTRGRLAIGCVKSCTPNFTPNSDITYSDILFVTPFTL